MPCVVINRCFGGFGLNYAATMRYAEIKGITLYPVIDRIAREVYGEKATFDNPEIRCHYFTKPGQDEDFCEEGTYWSIYGVDRADPALIQVIEELGKAANTPYSDLRIVDVPDDVQWYISEHDGNETVEEEHRSWS